MKNLRKEMLDIDGPFSFCGGSGSEEEIDLIGGSYFMEGGGMGAVMPAAPVNPDITGNGSLLDEAAAVATLGGAYLSMLPGGQFAGGALTITGITLGLIDDHGNN